MDANGGSFNFDEYQKKHEGLFQKFSRWLGKHLKALCTVGALGVIIAGIGVYKQFATTDAGKIIELIYQDAKDDIAETKQFLTYVQLPDSLEETTEVQRLRLFQNEIYSFSLLYLSVVKEPHYHKSNKKNNEINEYKQLAGAWMQNLLVLGNKNEEIIDECIGITNYFVDKEDSLALMSINLFTMAEVLHVVEDFDKLLSETSNNMKIKIKKNDVNGSIDILKKLLSDKRLYNCYKSLHSNNLMFLNAVNIRLLNIKNKEIENKHGRFKKIEKTDVFIPSFLNRGSINN